VGRGGNKGRGGERRHPGVGKRKKVKAIEATCGQARIAFPFSLYIDDRERMKARMRVAQDIIRTSRLTNRLCIDLPILSISGDITFIWNELFNFSVRVK
jgi:hypothetical protein